MSQQRDIELERWNELQKLRREVDSRNPSWAWRNPQTTRSVSEITTESQCVWDNVKGKWILPK